MQGGGPAQAVGGSFRLSTRPRARQRGRPGLPRHRSTGCGRGLRGHENRVRGISSAGWLRSGGGNSATARTRLHAPRLPASDDTAFVHTECWRMNCRFAFNHAPNGRNRVRMPECRLIAAPGHGPNSCRSVPPGEVTNRVPQQFLTLSGTPGTQPTCHAPCNLRCKRIISGGRSGPHFR